MSKRPKSISSNTSSVFLNPVVFSSASIQITPVSTYFYADWLKGNSFDFFFWHLLQDELLFLFTSEVSLLHSYIIIPLPVIVLILESCFWYFLIFSNFYFIFFCHLFPFSEITLINTFNLLQKSPTEWNLTILSYLT